MESFLNRYRNITVLLLVIFAQLILLAVQVKNDQDVRIIRLWTVTAVTPFARVVEGLRSGSLGLVRNYILLHKADADNRRLQSEVDRLKLENITLKNQLNQSDRAQALQLFQARTPSRTLAASVIGTGAGSSSKMVFVDRGTVAGVMRGMAVVTPDGIVGKVIAAYPTASQVLLITDQDFAAGVISPKGVRGTLKGLGTPLCKVDYVAFEEKVEPGEWFYTSGDDRIFPRGFPVGVVKSVRPDQPYKEIYVAPSGMQRGTEDVLILLEPVHQDVPGTPIASQPVFIAPPPPDSGGKAADVPAAAPAGAAGTEADKLRGVYKAAGEAQGLTVDGHTFAVGSGPKEAYSKLPDFTKLSQPGAAGGRGAGTGQGQAPPVGPVKPASPSAAPGTPAPPAKVPAATPPPGARPGPAAGRASQPGGGPPGGIPR